MCFYEKVIKVKADVAAVLIFPRCLNLLWCDLGSCQGRPEKGGVHLDL